MLCFVLAAVCFVVVILPFDTTLDGSRLQCGPAAFELLVPADAAWDVPEDIGCPPIARRRVALGMVGLVLAVAGASVILIRGRDRTSETQTAWLGVASGRVRDPHRARRGEKTPQQLAE